jgi:hypothetical protein
MTGCSREAGAKPAATAGDPQGGARVFVIVLGKQGFSEPLSHPSVAELALQYAKAVNYNAAAPDDWIRMRRAA